tara:strand:+ start:66 stop:1553 length:1488 start_codon:yes stop_codon:yes gene_type:complete
MQRKLTNEKIILGLSGAHHDGAACIVKGGKILAAIECERLTKRKKDDLTPSNMEETINYVLDAVGMELNDIDYTALSATPHDLQKNEIQWTDNLCNLGLRTCMIAHHLAHNASAYYTSPFDYSMSLSVDSSTGVPEYYFHNSSICIGKGNKIKSIETPPISYGILYHRVCEYLGIGVALHKVGTLMGVAPYGKPIPDTDFDLEEGHEVTNLIEEDFSRAVNIAATTQKLLEQRLLDLVEKLPANSENLCLSGGTFLNCPANSRILKESRFKKIHHFPGCGDSGIGIGAALYVAHHILDQPRYEYKPHEICYLGKEYKQENEIDYEYIARKISEGAIVAWMNGRSEFGPRALGNRSLLADPRNQHNRDRLNHVIKQREWYRPFAPIVLEECYKDWFDFDVPSPFMLYTAQVKKPQEIPAITHVDGSSRFQTVTEESNMHLYKLIKEFEKITGVPVLINTSLNGKGQPILESPEDGREFFNDVPVDIAVIHGEILER